MNQIREPDQIFIIDDYSTDNSEEVLSALELKYGIEVIRNDKNLGIIQNFKKAVTFAKSDYIVFVGADNRIKPDFIEKFARAAQKYPNGAVFYCDIELFGPKAKEIADKVDAQEQEDGTFIWTFPNPTTEVLKQIDGVNFMHGSSMFSRQWYEKVGGYQESTHPEDFDLFRRIVKAGGEPIHVAVPTLEYRQYSPNQINTIRTMEMFVIQLQHDLKLAREEIAARIENFDTFYKQMEERNLEMNELVQQNSHADIIIRHFGYSDFRQFIQETESRSIYSRFQYRLIQLSGLPSRLIRVLLRRSKR